MKNLRFLFLFTTIIVCKLQGEKMPIWNEFSAILKPSSLGGVGVFAAHDIPKGTPVFTASVNTRTMKIKDVPEEFLKYAVYLNDEECWVPERCDRMEIGWYLNHSSEPNITKTSKTSAIACRDIKAGEEILLNYNELDEPDHLKESYYWTPDKDQ